MVDTLTLLCFMHYLYKSYFYLHIHLFKVFDFSHYAKNGNLV